MRSSCAGHISFGFCNHISSRGAAVIRTCNITGKLPYIGTSGKSVSWWSETEQKRHDKTGGARTVACRQALGDDNSWHSRSENNPVNTDYDTSYEILASLDIQLSRSLPPMPSCTVTMYL
jgi:hypothetical protein